MMELKIIRYNFRILDSINQEQISYGSGRLYISINKNSNLNQSNINKYIKNEIKDRFSLESNISLNQCDIFISIITTKSSKLYHHQAEYNSRFKIIFNNVNYNSLLLSGFAFITGFFIHKWLNNSDVNSVTN